MIGYFDTDYTPANTSIWDNNDCLFVIGNGTWYDSRSDALVMLKNVNTRLNGELEVITTAPSHPKHIAVSTVFEIDILVS